MKLGCLLTVVTVALLVGGGQGLYTAVTNGSPKEYSLEEYVVQKPAAKWLRLTGGTLDLTNLDYTSFLRVGHITEIYVPLKPAGASAEDVVHVMVVTKNPALLDLAEKMRGIETDGQTARFLQEHGDQLLVKRNVQGLVRFGIELRDRDERKLRQLNKNLAQDFIVLAENEKPDYFQPLAFFFGGVALAAFLLKKMTGSSSGQPPPLPPLSVPPPLPTP